MFKKIKQILYRSLETKEISYKRLKEIIKNNPKALIVDVRSKQEYNEGHLDSAINIPLHDLEKQLDKLPGKNETTILYCRSGHRSRQAKEKLEKLGYENIYN